MRHYCIYLSGSIRKGPEDARASFWAMEDICRLEKMLLPEIAVFLDPAVRADDVNDPVSVFGHDLVQVYCSDLLLLDARDRRGLGVGVEMAFAVQHEIPVVVLGKCHSHYFKDSLEYLGQTVSPFVHPFIYSLASYIGYSLDDVAEFIRTNVDSAASRQPPMTPLFLSAMRSYIARSFSQDYPMIDVVRRSRRARERLRSLADGVFMGGAIDEISIISAAE